MSENNLISMINENGEEDEETLRAVFGLFKKAHPELKLKKRNGNEKEKIFYSGISSCNSFFD